MAVNLNQFSLNNLLAGLIIFIFFVCLFIFAMWLIIMGLNYQPNINDESNKDWEHISQNNLFNNIIKNINIPLPPDWVESVYNPIIAESIYEGAIIIDPSIWGETIYNPIISESNYGMIDMEDLILWAETIYKFPIPESIYD